MDTGVDDVLCRHWNASSAVQPNSKPSSSVRRWSLGGDASQVRWWHTGSVLGATLLLPADPQRRHGRHPRRGRISTADEYAFTEVLHGGRWRQERIGKFQGTELNERLNYLHYSTALGPLCLSAKMRLASIKCLSYTIHSLHLSIPCIRFTWNWKAVKVSNLVAT